MRTLLAVLLSVLAVNAVYLNMAPYVTTATSGGAGIVNGITPQCGQSSYASISFLAPTSGYVVVELNPFEFHAFVYCYSFLSDRCSARNK
jgi:hypothetical protein